MIGKDVKSWQRGFAALNEYAKTLNDGKILAQLSAGDATAQELKYHKDGLTTLYNREKCHPAA